MSYTLSKKEIVAEILKCGKDPVYFIDNYARISHPIDGLILSRHTLIRLTYSKTSTTIDSM